MLASVYLFGELGAGYTQYLDDYTRHIFKEFAKKIMEEIEKIKAVK